MSERLTINERFDLRDRILQVCSTDNAIHLFARGVDPTLNGEFHSGDSLETKALEIVNWAERSCMMGNLLNALDRMERGHSSRTVSKDVGLDRTASIVLDTIPLATLEKYMSERKTREK